MKTDFLLQKEMEDFIELMMPLANMRHEGYGAFHTLTHTMAVIDHSVRMIALMDEVAEELDRELPRSEKSEAIRWDDWQNCLRELRTTGTSLLLAHMTDEDMGGVIGKLNVQWLRTYVNDMLRLYDGTEKKLKPIDKVKKDRVAFAREVVVRFVAVVKYQSMLMGKLLMKIRDKLECTTSQLLSEYGEKLVRDYQDGKEWKEAVKTVRKSLNGYTPGDRPEQSKKILRKAWTEVKSNEIIKARLRDNTSDEMFLDAEVADASTKQAYRSYLDEDGVLRYEVFARKVYYGRSRFNNACVNQFLKYYLMEQYVNEQVTGRKKAATATAATTANKADATATTAIATANKAAATGCDTREAQKAVSFEKHVLVKDKAAVMKLLHALIDGRKGRDVAMVIRAAQCAEVLDGVKSTEVKMEFGDIGNVGGYNKQLKNFPNIDEEDYRKAYIAFRGIKEKDESRVA